MFAVASFWGDLERAILERGSLLLVQESRVVCKALLALDAVLNWKRGFKLP